ncbi:MAG: PIN domain-containing protein [Betaproteobacteria bacterium]|nr:PIN domain-containing protein [Betaproteobacteria bacterium]
MILVDAGPLVALIHADDRHHERCVKVLQALHEPLATVWPAYTEAMYLLGFSWRAQDALWELVERNVISLIELETRDHRRVRELMKKYRDLPMDLADAALVAVAERERIARVFTLDRRDFGVYRPGHGGRFQIIPEA